MSIDKAVRQVVTEVVDEVMTEKIDEKVKETVVEIQDDDFKDKVLAVLNETELNEVICWSDIGAVIEDNLDVSSAVESAIEDISPNSIGAAYEDHDHDDAYAIDGHNHEDEYWLDEAIGTAIQNYVDEHGFDGGGSGKADSGLLSYLGVVKMNGGYQTAVGSWNPEGHNMQAQIGKLRERIVELEKMVDTLKSGSDAGKYDQLVAWAKHIDKTLKSASSSQIFEEVPA